MRHSRHVGFRGVGGVEASNDSLELRVRFRVCLSLDSKVSSAGDRAEGSSDMESTTSLSGASGNSSGSGGDMPGTLNSCGKETNFRNTSKCKKNAVEKSATRMPQIYTCRTRREAANGGVSDFPGRSSSALNIS